MILIAIGANLPDALGRPPAVTCSAAVVALSELPGLRLEAVSRWYATAPVPASDQPDFVNGIARLSGTAAPEWLLARLHAIEAAVGRVRSVADAARPLDLDLIAMGGLMRDAAPILPHPRAHLRRFVLEPLCDVAPDWVHPRLRRTAADLLHCNLAERRDGR